MARKLKIDDFVKKSNEVHSGFYSYEKSLYVNNKTKVEMCCPLHGVFFQCPSDHLRGTGCMQCGIDKKRHSTEDFIKKANFIHNGLYSYDESVYLGRYIPIRIKCSVHGVFYQAPVVHIAQKSGCSKCAFEKKTFRSFKNKDDFLIQAHLIHGAKYEYDKIVCFDRIHDKVEILCLDHGYFFQSIYRHIYDGCGCPICKESRGEREVRKILEEFNIIFEIERIFLNCKDKSFLRFDFFIPSQLVCIEYDGEFHFNECKNWNRKDKLEDCQRRDQIKNKFCEENGIKLLRIPYYEFDQIREKILEVISVNIKECNI